MQFILFYSLKIMLLCIDEPIIDYGVMFNVHIVMSCVTCCILANITDFSHLQPKEISTIQKPTKFSFATHLLRYLDLRAIVARATRSV